MEPIETQPIEFVPGDKHLTARLGSEKNNALSPSQWGIHGNFISTMRILNASNTPVTVSEISGARYTVYRDKNNDELNKLGNVVIIKRDYNIDVKLAEIMANYYREQKDTLSLSDGWAIVVEELILKLEIAEKSGQNFNKGFSFRTTVDQIIQISNLNREDVFIMTHLGICLSTRYDINNMPEHPFSKSQKLIDKYNKLTDTIDSLQFNIEFIDNELKYSDRFFTLGNRVYRIKPKVNPDMPSGVYYAAFTKDRNGNIIFRDKAEYTVEQAKTEIGLYASEEEAVTKGDTALQLHKQIGENKVISAELENKKLEIERLQMEDEARYEHQKSVYEKELLEFKNKYEKLKLERTDHYEQRSIERKDSSEIIKFIPAIITAGIAIFVIISKSSGSSKKIRL